MSRLHQDPRQQVTRLIDWLVPPSVAEGPDGQRARLAAGIALLMAVVFGVLATTHAIAGSFQEAWTNAALAALVAAAPLVIRSTGRYGLTVNLTLAIVLGLVVSIGSGARGAGVNAATVALAEIPLFATLLAGPRIGLLWVALSCGASGLIGWAGYTGLVENRFPVRSRLFDDHVVLVVITLTLYLVAALYERMRAQGLAHAATLDAGRRQAELEKVEAQAEARVATAEHLASLGGVAAATAHEINNPLSYVANNLEYALARPELQAHPEVATALSEAQDGVRRIQRIVTDLKAFARPEEETLGAVDVTRALRAALKMAEGHTRSRARVETDLPELPLVMGSETRLVQVFLNLLVNAAQALPDGRAESNQIIVRGRARGDRVEIEIQDTGTGIPEEVQERLGQPFFTTKQHGLGLGLAVCRRVLSRLGGELAIDSAPGRTVVRVVLARATVETETGLASDRAPRTSASIERGAAARVLIVDDEPLVARGIARHLSEHHVTIARSGREALEFLDGGAEPDVILCDVMMPDFSGMDVYAAVADRHPHLLPRLTFMTGGTFTAAGAEFQARVGGRFLEKPVDVERVQALVAERAPPAGR